MLLANQLALLCADPARAVPATGLAFRLKLLLAAGILPHLGACAGCGESEHLQGFSAAAGGVVCGSCEAAAFSLDEDAYGFLVTALGRPLAQAPTASDRALRQAERAIIETAEHHGTCGCARCSTAARRRSCRTSKQRASPRGGAVRIGV